MNTKTQRSLNEVFNVDPIPDEVVERTSKDVTLVDDEIPSDQLAPLDDQQYKLEDQQIKNDFSDDYEDARDNLKRMIDRGDQLLDLAIQLAQGTEDPKSIDSAIKLIGQMTDLNTKLLDLTAKKQDVFVKTRPKANKFSNGINGDPSEQSVIGSVTNNTMFVGSPTDLLNMLKNQQGGETIINVPNDIKENNA